MSATPFLVASTPPEEVVRQYEAAFFEDAHVVAAALATQADFLLTLDRPLERRVKQANLAVIALSPREFLQDVLPRHPEYGRIRQEG